MRSTMQEVPLLISHILRHGQTVHGDSEVVTVDRRRATAAPPSPRSAPRPSGWPRRSAGSGVGDGRPGRHLHLEQPGAPGRLPGRPVHGRGAAHAQHPALPRAAQLRRQPRRGQGDHRRRHAPPAAGQRVGRPEDGRAPDRGRRRRHRAVRRRPSPSTSCWRPRSPATTGPSSTSSTPPPCVTRAAPPATPRASSTRTARPSCTRWRTPRPPRSG